MRILVALTLSLWATLAQASQIEVLHWWTAGGEAEAVNVLRQHWQAAGNQWIDSTVPGGGGKAAMLVLRSQALNEQPPQAAHLKGGELHEWANLGFLRSLDDIARQDQWQTKLYPFVSSTLNNQGHFAGVPIGIHRVNWLWINQSLFDRYHLQPPKNWDELQDVAEKFKQAGVTPLAMGDDPWQQAIVFESLVLGDGGSDLFRRAFVNLEPEALSGQQMQKILQRFHNLRAYLPANHIDLKWNQATRMLIKGQVAMQLMGDWVKGELMASGEQPGQRIRCLPAPGTADKFSYNLDSFALFKQQKIERDLAQQQLAHLILDENFQKEFNRVKGSIPPLVNVDLSSFDKCAQASAQALQQASNSGNLVPSFAEGMVISPQVQQAILDVLSNYFGDPDADAETAAQQLARAVKAAQAEQFTAR